MVWEISGFVLTDILLMCVFIYLAAFIEHLLSQACFSVVSKTDSVPVLRAFTAHGTESNNHTNKR